MNKILSIIIPMYNTKMYIEKCLNSLLLPEVMIKKLDILVVNDGSTDGCELLVSKYVSRYPDCIRLFNKVNGGHGSVINYAVPYCRGKYFRVLDSDDWFSTKELEKFVNYLETINQVDIVLSPYQTFNIRTKKYCFVDANFYPTVMEMEDLIDHWSSLKVISSLHALTYNTAFYNLLSYALPEGVYYDDAFYSTIPAYQAKNIAIATSPVYIYRIGDVNQSVSSENRVKRIDQLYTVIWSMCDAFDEKVLGCNKSYFYYKTVSVLADYFITACLRYPRRREGRKMACAMETSLKVRNPMLFKRARKKYIFLYLLSVLGVSENIFIKCMQTMYRVGREG